MYREFIIKDSGKLLYLQSWSSLLFGFHPGNQSIMATAQFEG